MWFLVTLLSITALNYLLYYLIFKFKYLLIVPLKVLGLFTGYFKFYRPNFFLTISYLLANI